MGLNKPIKTYTYTLPQNFLRNTFIVAIQFFRIEVDLSKYYSQKSASIGLHEKSFNDKSLYLHGGILWYRKKDSNSILPSKRKNVYNIHDIH